jgi:hypothetical protein
MTTIRERVERGIEDEEVTKFFWKNQGAIPLCCFETNAKWKIRCGHTKKFLSRDEFTHVCLKCQDEIATMLLAKTLVEKKK